MTHPNHETNGASLEDCHTNFYALTDLCGIKWRKLVWGECNNSSSSGNSGVSNSSNSGFGGGVCTDVLNDPVLSSYSRCLMNDILCVWRRVGSPQHQQQQHHQQQQQQQSSASGSLYDPLAGLHTSSMSCSAPLAPPQLSLNAAKELWIFWYGEEPDLSTLVNPELLASSNEQGSWENGLSYECRSLLFKALHNLIERCLLSRDFVRLGKWFVQPYDGSKKLIENSSSHLSISFSFFVHGESTVCISIDVRQHPPVRTLVKEHLEQMQSCPHSSPPIQVILAPFGLTGTLTGQSFKASEMQTQKVLEEWRNFYPLSFNNTGCGVEPVVEIMIAGIKLKYPSCYVLVTDLDESTSSFYGTSVLSSPKTSAANQPVSGAPVTVVPLHQHHPESMAHPSSPATVLPERAWQDSVSCLPETPPVSPCHTPLQSSNTNSGSGGDSQESSYSLGHWNFHDPHRKCSCGCFNKSGGGGTTSKHQSHSQQQHSASTHQQSGAIGVSGMDNACGSMLPLNTPPSIAPSPLTNPNSCQPSSVPNVSDPMMPTLSPQHPPPVTPLEDKVARTPTDFQGPKSLSSLSNHVYSPYPSAPSIENTTLYCSPSVNTSSNMVGSNPSIKPVPSTSLGGSKFGCVEPVQTSSCSSKRGSSSTYSPANYIDSDQPTVVAIKRPRLCTKEYETVSEEEEQPTSLKLLYDYSTTDAWLSHPVKKFKPFEPRIEPPTRGPSTCGSSASFLSNTSLWSSYNNIPYTSSSNSNSNSSSGNSYSSSFNNGYREPNINCVSSENSTKSRYVDSNAVKTKLDRYESENETCSDGKCQVIKSNNSPAIKNEERKHEQASINSTGNLTNGVTSQSDGSVTSFKDLDQMFETPDDMSSDEALQMQTPPGSNKPATYIEDGNIYSGNTATLLVRPPRGSGGSTNAGILKQEELSKMFPTPPSMEHNPIASPSGGHLSDTPICEPSDYLVPLNINRVKQEPVVNTTYSQPESIDDWSYVYRPPTVAPMVGSSKYAPLSTLPSQNLPPLTLPSNCVYKPSYFYPHRLEKKLPVNPNPPNFVPSLTGNAGNMMHHHPLGSPLRPPPPGQMMLHPPPPHHHPLSLPHQIPQSPHGMKTPHGPLHHPGLYPRMGLSPISPAPYPPSPMMGWQQPYRPPGVRTPCHPPPPYSPINAAAANSYLNKPLSHMDSMVRSPPEVNSLMITVLLTDSLLNIFRDHNFDSCTLCVCNAGPKVVGNIRGADAATYLPQSAGAVMPSTSPYSPYSPAQHHFLEEDSIRCSCGFSAVVNRRLSHRAGLFYEDEAEITGILDDPVEKDDLNGATLSVVDLIREQCVVIHSSCNALYRAARQYKPPTPPATLNLLEFSDTNQTVIIALEQGRLAQIEAQTGMCKIEDVGRPQPMMGQHCPTTGLVNTRSPCVHRWPFMRAKGPRCNQDIIRVMKVLQPLLQDAIQKRCSTRLWDAPYTVSGPLTWRQFHRLAGRGTDDKCEPQPIPPVLAGHDKDWVSLSPYALHYWEKLLLEPYSYCRDIAYVVVAPDNEYVLQRVRTFFRELSSSYEVCRLGRHCPVTKVLRDGILRVGKSAAVKLSKEPVDEWFNMLGENSTTAALRLYAQVCRHYLTPQLSQFTMDSSLLDPPETNNPSRVNNIVTADVLRPTPSPMPPPPSTTPDSTSCGSSQGSSDKTPSTPKSESQDDGGRNEQSSTFSSSLTSDGSYHDDEDGHPPAVVIYLVEPFSVGSDDPELHRLACLALLRCYKNTLSSLPENVRNNVVVQVISLESILELGRSGDRNRHSDEMRALALSVYSQCRRLLLHTSNVKALTGFGTAAMTDIFLKNKDEKNRAPYRAYCPPYILAKGREKLKNNGDSIDSISSTGNTSTADQHSSILYVSYCLSEDQKWILVTATDEQGIILDSATINIYVPNRNRRRKAPARRIGLQKVMDFILGVMSQSVRPWRLVVGRVGRLGHGELKGWSWLLSRKSLVRASKHLKEICGQCSLLSDVPCILSACLVSLEADSNLRVMPDQFTPDERFSQASVNRHLSTPHDVTCTHILVFPTSATTQSSQTAFQEQQNNGPDLGDDELFNAVYDDMSEGMGDLNDIFSTWPETDVPGLRSPLGSPRGKGGSQPGSPLCSFGDPSDQRSPFACNGGPSRTGANSSEVQEEVGALLQQPLALGYLVSTAPTGRMPRSFWSSCPHLENVCPAFLKSALHMHTTQQSTDELLPQSSTSGHPLDSQFTTDVLRYVLEGYNTLSWLAIDSNTHDRLSCLPVHIQVLMQLYHMMLALI